MPPSSESIPRFRALGDVRVPTFLYGTAWKEDSTQHLVHQAIETGFCGIDTANQRKHYHEAGVGAALREVFAAGRSRESLFIQTKFTYRRGQDHRLPYDPNAELAVQVAQSMDSSLVHLGMDYVDAYLLHGPSVGGQRLAEADWQVWRAMEALVDAGKTQLLGVSNVSLGQLKALVAGARIKPAFVQNRCYASRGWDAGVRACCREAGIVYQGFSLLTANRQVLQGQEVAAIAQRLGVTPAQVIFRFVMQVGMLPLTGTTDVEHMQQDLGVYDFELSYDDVAVLTKASR